MGNPVDGKSPERRQGMSNTERDVVALGIAAAAIILFVGTGGAVMPQIVRAWLGTGAAPDASLSNAVLLNSALLIFGWRRYKDLSCEVAERRRAEAKARELAEIDPLTGCLNRRSGTPAIEQLYATSRERHREVAVFMIDLDCFKQINDLNGHRVGDRVLTTIAMRIKSLLPSEGVIARIGGDEFVCAMSYEAHAQNCVEQLAAQLISTVSAPIEDEHTYVEPTISLGISITAGERDDSITAGERDDDYARQAETLIHRADMAMYQAKNRGRNRYCWFEPQMEDELRFRNELEAGIRRGIPAGEFVPYYEQQIDLRTGELTGFKMLARWNSPQYGLVSPEVFLPVAEEIDLISELSECLIRQALRDAKEWNSCLILSLAISPLQLRDPWLAQKLLHLLVESGFQATRLEIEISERCLHQDIGAVRSLVSSLKNQGIGVSVGDFGTGYISLAQLRSLPFDLLKIDRSLASELIRKEGNSDLVNAILSFDKGLSLPVTAEGGETPKSLSALRTLGEPLKGRGYLYDTPENADATRTRLAQLKLLAAEVADPAPAGASLRVEQRKAS